MRIGVDATCWANNRGYGRFAREVMDALLALQTGDEFLAFGDAPSFAAWRTHQPPDLRLIEVPLSVSPTTAASSTSRRSMSDMLRLTSAVRRARPDVFWYPTVYTYFPLPPGIPGVVTIHDTIPERFPHLTLPSWSARASWNAKVRLSLWQCRTVLTVSEHAARSIASILHVATDRLRVTTEAPAAIYRPSDAAAQAEAAARVGVPPGAPWFVYVGGFNPHKRVDTILGAHAALARDTTPAPHLVLVGARADVFHGETGRLDALIDASGTGSLVHWPGFVPDEALVPLLGGASALLLPSEAEGFGLPAVEAAACGTPVIATTESPLPELLEGGGIFVAPGDQHAVENGMRAMLDPARRAPLAAAALRRVAVMSWDSAARHVLAALQDAV